MSKKSVRLKDFSVGQTAYMLVANRQGRYVGEPIECSVIGVGRKYVSVDYGAWNHQFMVSEYLDSAPYLEEKTEIGYRGRLFPSKEAAAEYQELQNLCQWVQEATSHSKLKAYSLEQLRAVNRILSNSDYNNPAGKPAP